MKRVPAAIVTVLLTSACSSLPEPEGPTAQTPQPQPVVQTAVPTTTTPPPTTPPPTPPAQTPVPATAARPAGAFEPVGDYTFSVDIGGNTATGTIAIVKGQDGKLGGSISSDQGSVPINTVMVEGRKLTLTASLPNGPDIVFVLNFEANHNDYTGTLDFQGMSGAVTGARKKS